MRLSTLLLATVVLSAGSPAQALDFDRLGGTMVAFGKIEPGDYQKFLHEYLSWEVPPQIFALDSRGGNVFEAIAIANFVRITRIPVWVSGECFSSCAFIYLAAPTRQATGTIGLHRPYYEPGYFSELSSLDAESEFELLKQLTRTFLVDIGVERSIIEIINTVPSDQVRIFEGREETSRMLKEESPFMEEWRISKCGSVEQNQAISWCAVHWIKYLRLNLNLVEGWEEEFLKDPEAKFKKDMPGMCHAVASESQSLALSAIQNEVILDLAKSRAEPVYDRHKCVKKAEDNEVWAFFKTMKESPKARALFDNPAKEMVLQKYLR